MLSSHSKILAEAISIAFTSLQQRQSISLALFLQCPHLHQSRFPILICNKSTAEAYVQFFFSWLSFQSRFPILLCNKTAAEAYVQFQKWPPQVLCKKGVLKNFANFTGKHLCWSLFLIKLQVFRPATLLKGDANTIIFL